MKTRRNIAILCLIIVGCIVAVVAPYVIALGALPFSRSSAEPWGQFGDYVGGLLNPILALLNLSVVFYIALFVHKFGEDERKKERDSEQKIQVVVDLHREWNGEVMYKTRMLASPLVRKYPLLSIFEIEKVATYDEVAKVWIVIGFFQRLSYLVEHEKLHKDMTVELFGELFVWWWIVSFESQLGPSECDARDRILYLKNWVYENTTVQKRSPWIQRAQLKAGSSG